MCVLALLIPRFSPPASFLFLKGFVRCHLLDLQYSNAPVPHCIDLGVYRPDGQEQLAPIRSAGRLFLIQFHLIRFFFMAIITDVSSVRFTSIMLLFYFIPCS